jgi:hypothetical protein
MRLVCCYIGQLNNLCSLLNITRAREGGYLGGARRGHQKCLHNFKFDNLVGDLGTEGVILKRLLKN